MWREPHRPDEATPQEFQRWHRAREAWDRRSWQDFLGDVLAAQRTPEEDEVWAAFHRRFSRDVRPEDWDVRVQSARALWEQSGGKPQDFREPRKPGDT